MLLTEGNGKDIKMQDLLKGLVSFGGRGFLILIFLMSAVGNKIPKFSSVVEYMKSEGVPAPQVLLAGAIVFLIAGSVSVLIGYKSRIGASLLLVFLALATYYIHDFWTVSKDAAWVLSLNSEVQQPVAQVEMISFMKNLALMGAMIFIIANGPGAGSLDNRKPSTKD